VWHDALGQVRRQRPLSDREKSERRLHEVRGHLDDRPWLITIARFVPYLRTVTMDAAGSLEFPRRRFLTPREPGPADRSAGPGVMALFSFRPE
jgi:membrane protein DedA with SNARE-associated domain